MIIIPHMSLPEEKSPRPAVDADAMAKALEIELLQKRAAWQRARARRGTYRALSLLFLVLILLGAVLAYFFFMPTLSHHSGEAPQTETTAADR